MIGTLVNVACIVTGTLAGTLFKKGLGEKYTKTLYTAMGLAAVALGANAFVQNLPKSEYPVLFILSLAAGGVAGTALDLDGRVKRLLARHTGAGLASGLISACLLFCIGTFSIVGPILSATRGDNTFLYTNATLDLVTSMVFAASYGIGILLAAPVLFCWQGTIYCLALAGASGPLLQGPMVGELSVVGGVLIIASGLTILEIKDCKTLNFIPSLLVPVLWYVGKSLF